MIKKILATIMMLCMASGTWAGIQQVSRSYTSNGTLISETSYSKDSGNTLTVYDSLGRFSYSRDKDNNISQKCLYGDNGSKVLLQRISTTEDKFTAIYTTEGGDLQVSATINGDIKTASLSSLGITADQISEAYTKFKAQSTSNAHNVATFAEMLAMVTGKYTTNKDGSRTLNESFVSSVMVYQCTAEMCNNLNNVLLARLLGYKSGATSGTVNGIKYTNLGNGEGGNGETSIFINNIAAAVKAVVKAGVGFNMIQFSGDANAKGQDQETTKDGKVGTGGVRIAATIYTTKETSAKQTDAKGKTVTETISTTKGLNITNDTKGCLSYDPLVQGTVLGVQVIDGKSYVRVQASKVDMYDGKGFQQADGEEIWVQVDENTAANVQANLASGNDQIIIAGNVTADTNGHLTMTMNEGSYASGNDAKKVTDNWFSAHSGFYNKMISDMSSTWSAAKASGAGSDWKSGWNFLKAATSNGKLVSPNF